MHVLLLFMYFYFTPEGDEMYSSQPEEEVDNSPSAEASEPAVATDPSEPAVAADPSGSNPACSEHWIRHEQSLH